MSDERPIRLVLDTSAVLAFVRQSVHVGEVLVEVDDNNAVAAIPLACLVEAVRDAVDQDQLALLAEHLSTVVFGAAVEDWRALGALCAITGGYAAATAALTAMDASCWILTARPELYEHIAAGGLVVPIED